MICKVLSFSFLTFIIAGGMSIIGCRCVLRAPISVSKGKVTSYFFLLYITLKSMLGSLVLQLFVAAAVGPMIEIE